MKKPLASPDRVRELLSYNPDTGLLRWRVSGATVGTLNGNGYLRLMIDGRLYLAHRVIWAIQTGAWPSDRIDHRDMDGSNNRWANLRQATAGQNNANRRAQRNKLVPLKGVTPSKSKKNPFIAQINIGGRVRHLGMFKTAEAAHGAFIEESKRHFGSYVREA